MARLRPRGAYWELAWTDGAGKRRSRSLGRRSAISERDAKLALKKLQRDIFLEKHRLTAPVSPTVSAWRTEYLAWHAAQYPSSHYRVAQILEQHVPDDWLLKRLDMLDDKDVETAKTAWRAMGFKDQTIAKMLRVVKAWLNRAVERKVLTESPAAIVKAPQILDARPHRFYSLDELAELYKASAEDLHHPEAPQFEPWHAPAWKLFANTGMRRGEGAALKRRWVGRDGLKIISTGEERTKAGEWRDVPLFPGAAEALDALPKDGEYVLPRIALPSLSRAAIKCIRRAGLDGSLHTLRHTFISHLAMDPTVPVRSIQLWAGHASIETTEKYLYLRAPAPTAALNL